MRSRRRVRRSYPGFILDADNTLFDFDRAERDALMETFAGLRLPAAALAGAIDRYMEINRGVWRMLERGEIDPDSLKVERFRRLLGELGISADPAALSAAYLERLSRKAYLMPSAVETLAGLVGRGAGLALLTNGISQVQRGRLARSGIGRYFRAILISEEVGLAKPDPAIFLLAAERLGLEAGDVLCVGDSAASDIRGAARAGMAACWLRAPGAGYPPGEPLPDFMIDGLDELLDFAPGGLA